MLSVGTGDSVSRITYLNFTQQPDDKHQEQNTYSLSEYLDFLTYNNLANGTEGILSRASNSKNKTSLYIILRRKHLLSFRPVFEKSFSAGHFPQKR